MADKRCKNYVTTKGGKKKIQYLKHSWVPQGKFQKCTKCGYIKPMTKVFASRWEKLQKQLKSIRR